MPDTTNLTDPDNWMQVAGHAADLISDVFDKEISKPNDRRDESTVAVLSGLAAMLGWMIDHSDQRTEADQIVDQLVADGYVARIPQYTVDDIEPTEHDRRHYWTQQGVRLVPVSQAAPRLTPDHPHRVINVSADVGAAMSAGEARMLAAALLSAAARAEENPSD